VLVTIVSAVLVWRTKQQARQAATRARTEAVNYLREAQSDLKNGRSVTHQAVVRLQRPDYRRARTFALHRHVPATVRDRAKLAFGR
jgi:hypothetical protein